jgi:nicotinamidase-related amidase
MAVTTTPAGQTALVLLDFQEDVLDRNLPDPAAAEALVSRTAGVLAAARSASIPVFHVVARFRPGYPEVSPRDLWRRDIHRTGRLLEGTRGAEITTALAPRPGEATVVKRRTGPFSTTDLEALLRARGVTRLVVAGVSTGGSVLSAVRTAADLDYSVVVLADCCADPDEEVHRVLCTKVFPRQAVVADSGRFLDAPGWSDDG